MANQIKLNVEPRTLAGRKVKQLRRQGIIPANIFGAKVKSQAIQVKTDLFLKIFKEAGETNLVYLTIGEEKSARPSLISAVQLHPVTDVPLHVDFHQVDLTQKVTANIPLEIVGISSAETDLGAVVVQLVNEIEVEALPTDLPEKFEVDQSVLKEIGQVIAVKDLKVDATKVEVKTDPEQLILQAQEPQKEEEPVAETPAEGETPASAETEAKTEETTSTEKQSE